MSAWGWSYICGRVMEDATPDADRTCRQNKGGKDTCAQWDFAIYRRTPRLIFRVGSGRWIGSDQTLRGVGVWGRQRIKRPVGVADPLR
jgi:hypothetical protein